MIELTLPTMTCGHCVRTVTDTLKKLDPAAAVEIDLPRHAVRVDTARSEAEVRYALTDEGYAPSP